MYKNRETKKLTLDDVLQKLQAGGGIEAVTNADNVKGGGASSPAVLYNGCHPKSAA